MDLEKKYQSDENIPSFENKTAEDNVVNPEKNPDDLIEEELNILENKGQEVMDMLTDVGGPEALAATIKSMSPEEIKDLDLKIKESRDKISQEKMQGTENQLVMELPTMISAFFISLSYLIATQEPDGIHYAVIAGVLATLVAAIPTFFAIHEYKNEGTITTGISSAIKVMKEKKNLKGLLNTKNKASI